MGLMYDYLEHITISCSYSMHTRTHNSSVPTHILKTSLLKDTKYAYIFLQGQYSIVHVNYRKGGRYIDK